MKRLIVSLILVLSVNTSHAADWSWDRADYIRQIICTTLTVIDFGQTRDIKNHRELVEMNVVLGPHPSDRAINNYFGIVLVVQPLVAMALPREIDTKWFGKLYPRVGFEYAYIGVEGVTTLSNTFRYGLNLDYKF